MSFILVMTLSQQKKNQFKKNHTFEENHCYLFQGFGLGTM